MDFLKTFKEESTNKSQQVCPKCHGKKIVYGKDIINVMNLCGRCGGYGELDWVEYATGNTTHQINADLGLHLTVRNAEILAQKIKELFMLSGTMVRVSVNTINQRPFYLGHPIAKYKEGTKHKNGGMIEELDQELISI